jgi:hypothetical protein
MMGFQPGHGVKTRGAHLIVKNVPAELGGCTGVAILQPGRAIELDVSEWSPS